MKDTKDSFKDKVLYFFFPLSYARMYVQSAGALLFIMVIMLCTSGRLHNQLAPHLISGRITSIKIGTKGGGLSGKYSGGSTYYHIKLAGYKRNFLLSDASIFENWQFDADDLKVGDLASFKIMKADEPNLQKSTEYRVQRNIPWPQEASSIKIYGLNINGHEVLSVGATLRGQSYSQWFFIIIPLLLYAIFNILIRTGFKNWTQKADDKDIDKMILDMEKQDIYKSASESIARIESELIGLGDWQAAAPNPTIFDDMGAFGSNTMPFTTWLQFVFIPNVKTIIGERGEFPESSSVAAYAFRNLDEERYATLNTLLSNFDALFNKGSR